MTDLPAAKLCPAPDCGKTFRRRPTQSPAQWRAQKFCSRPCSYKGQRRPGRTPGELCGNNLHPMTPDNTYRYNDGRRRCVACCRVRDAKRPDRKPGARIRTGTTAARPKRPLRAAPTPHARQPAPPESARSRRIWRPPGWSPIPLTRGESA